MNPARGIRWSWLALLGPLACGAPSEALTLREAVAAGGVSMHVIAGAGLEQGRAIAVALEVHGGKGPGCTRLSEPLDFSVNGVQAQTPYQGSTGGDVGCIGPRASWAGAQFESVRGRTTVAVHAPSATLVMEMDGLLEAALVDLPVQSTPGVDGGDSHVDQRWGEPLSLRVDGLQRALGLTYQFAYASEAASSEQPGSDVTLKPSQLEDGVFVWPLTADDPRVAPGSVAWPPSSFPVDGQLSMALSGTGEPTCPAGVPCSVALESHRAYRLRLSR